MEVFKKLYPFEFYEQFLAENLRPDGRKIQEFRDVSISAGSITSAYGSAMVKIGNSSVAAGVQAELSLPDENVSSSQIIINVEMGGICGENIGGGKPSSLSQSIAAQLQSLVEQCKIINNDSLFITTDDGEKVFWYLIVDLYCLDFDGNVFGTCLIALLTALHNTRLPEVKMENDKLVASSKNTIPLSLTSDIPIALSFAKFKDNIIIDPSLEEDELRTSAVTIVQTSSGIIYSVSIPGGDPIDDATLRECFKISRKYANYVSEKINIALKS